MSRTLRWGATLTTVVVGVATHRLLSFAAPLWAQPAIVAQLQPSDAAALRAHWIANPQWLVDGGVTLIVALALWIVWRRA